MKVQMTLDLDLSRAKDRDTYLAIYENVERVKNEVKVEPAAVEPAAVEPAAVEPAAVEPAAVEPAAVEPAAVEPAAVEPAAPTLEDVRKMLQLKAPAHYDACAAILKDYGAENASKLEAKHFSAVLTALSSL